MAVPKRRTSRAAKGKRRSHMARHPVQNQYCTHCSEPTLPHCVCTNCGWYRGVEWVKKEAEEK